MASIEKITRHPYINNIRKINEVIDELNRLLASYEKDVWHLDKNINKIAKNTDLNSLITQGTYTCPDATVAATLGHTPHTSSNFRLVVTENIDGYISQLVYVYNDAVYMRGRSGGSKPTWTDWHKNAWTDSDITGNAATATKLKTPVSLQTNLASSSPANFDGSQNVSFGVTGVLPVSHGGTGKTNLNDVKVGSASHADEASYATKAGNVEPELIPANVDLNNYTHYGLYYCPKNVDAVTIGHCPTDGNAFALVVLLEAGVAQICVQYGTNTHNIYHRNYYNGVWGDWALLITDKNIKIYFDEIEDVIRTVRGDGTDEYPHIDTRIDEGDFINMAPKIGKYGEDQVQVTASYDISNIDYLHHQAPVITADFLDREVMYWVGNGGGPDRATKGLHKAYKSMFTGEKGQADADWAWYNYNMVPACFATKGEISYNTIYGCDNDYLIVQIKENDVTKFYRIITDGNFDEQKWTKCQDITTALDGGSAKIIPGTDIKYRYLLHVKFFKSWNTIACIWSTSLNLLEDNWYYITIWSCTSNVNNTPTFVWGGPFPGLNKTIALPPGYEYDEVDGAVSVNSGGAPTADTCTVTIAETKSTITLVRHNARFYVYQGNARKLSQTYSIPTVYQLNSTSFFNTDKTLTRTITLANSKGDFIPFAGSNYTTNYTALNSALAPAASTALSHLVNNMSYDTRNGMIYTTGFNVARELILRRIALSGYVSVSNDNFKYNGLKVDGYVKTFKLPDASYWGKAFGISCAMWDQIFISCNSNDGDYFLQIDPDYWQYVKGKTTEDTNTYENALYIEPMPGAPKIVDSSKFSTILNTDLVTGARTFTGADLHNIDRFPFDSLTEIRGITSVKNGTAAEYYRAQYDKTNNQIVWCQYTKTAGKDPIEITKVDKTKITVTGLTGSLFNNENAANTFIYPGFVAYNPMANMFYIWGVRDDTTWDINHNAKIPHIVGINASTGEAKSFLHNDVTSKPSDYKWLDTENGYPGTVTGPTYYTPYCPYGATVISKTQMMVFFNCGVPGGTRNLYGLLYTFSSDQRTLKSVTACFTGNSGIGYLAQYGSPDFCRMPLMYSGPKLGFCGFGETHNGKDPYRDNYKINIRTQKPILDGQDYTDEQIMDDIDNNINVYTMFNQSASGLIANIPQMDIFLGGYHSRITKARQVTGLKANTKNYIFMRRIPGNRTEDGIVASSSTVKTIPIGADVFDKICVAVVQTDADKPIKTLQYHVNTGENSWKFKAFSTETYEEYHKDL